MSRGPRIPPDMWAKARPATHGNRDTVDFTRCGRSRTNAKHTRSAWSSLPRWVSLCVAGEETLMPAAGPGSSAALQPSEDRRSESRSPSDQKASVVTKT